MKQRLFNLIKKIPAGLRRACFAVWVTGCVLLAIITLFAGIGGMIDPRTIAIPAILAMSLPGWLGANVITAIINLWVARRVSVVQWIVCLLSIGGFNAYCPLNVFHSEEVAPADSAFLFKVMTINTFGFHDEEDIYPDNTNRTASQIIHSGADLVFVQEIGFLSDMPIRHLTHEQIDSIGEIYPYTMFNDDKMVGILSRYPLTWVELPQPEQKYSGFEAAKLIVNDVELLAVSVHLQSLGLNEEDKLIFHQMTSGDSEVSWRSGSRQLYRKVAGAMRQRADQAALLEDALDGIDRQATLLAGDFNDINGCYAMRLLGRQGLKDTYSAVGVGPAVTYHADRFYFNIDHIMFGGDIKPIDIRVGDIKSSDHYPVFATYLIPRKGAMNKEK